MQEKSILKTEEDHLDTDIDRLLLRKTEFPESYLDNCAGHEVSEIE